MPRLRLFLKVCAQLSALAFFILGFWTGIIKEHFAQGACYLAFSIIIRQTEMEKTDED